MRAGDGGQQINYRRPYFLLVFKLYSKLLVLLFCGTSQLVQVKSYGIFSILQTPTVYNITIFSFLHHCSVSVFSLYTKGSFHFY